MTSVLIDRARGADLGAVLDLMRLQFREHAIEAPDERLRSAVAAVLADESLGAFLLARDGESAVGVAYVSFVWSLEHCGRSAWLDELYVVPERRGHGIGERLLQEVITLVQVAGCAAVDLEVEHAQRRAENLYRRAGFEPLTRARWVRRTLER